ncbi:phage tail protein [Natrialbaceae archaeon A-CW3]
MRTGRFIVTIDSVEVSGFRSVTIPGSSTEQGEYNRGADPNGEQRAWGQTTFSALEMERGVQPGDTRIFDWREDVRSGNLDDGRKAVAITLLDEMSEPLVEWTFQNAWIKQYRPPTLDASSSDEIGTETVRVAFDKMVTDWDPTDELETSFTYQPETVEPGDEMTFDASESEPSTAITSYEWDFGDGKTATGETVSHIYDTSGTYTVTLTVESDDDVDTRTATVSVESSDTGVDDSERTLAYYADDDGIVRTDGTTEAFDDWEHGVIETALLLDVINAWHSGEVVV